MDTEQPQFAVIGVGRFGAFWGRELSRFFPVSFYDVDAGRAAQVAPYGRWESLETCLQKDYIFLTIPIRRLEDFLKQHGGAIRAGSVVLDCASVKLAVQEWFTAHLPESVYYAASHPLFGPDSSRTGIRGHRIVVVPGRIARSRLERMYRLLDRLGLRIISTTAEEHDRAMARTQALTHWLGRSLTAFGVGPESIDTHGYRLLAQVAEWASRDSRELFQDMHQFNPFTQDVRARFRDALTGLDAELSSLTANPAPEDET